MQDKIPVLIVYALLGIFLGLTPLVINRNLAASAVQPASGPIGVRQGQLWPYALCLVATSILLVYTQHLRTAAPVFPMASTFLLIAMPVGAALLQRHSPYAALQAGAATFLACAVSATLPWWRRVQVGVTMSHEEMFVFASLWIVGTWIFLSDRFGGQTGRFERASMFVIYCIAALYFSFSLTPLSNPSVAGTLWHHWGAYVGPSELVLTGARLFYDMPAQYGAGPTTVLAITCGTDCWTSAYWVFGLASFGYSVLIGMLAWSLRSGNRYSDVLVLALCTLACTAWIAYPPAASAAFVTPSTGGMRFLPAVALAAWIVFSGQRDIRTRTWGEYIFWVIGILWSPESAFYVTLIWWPIYLFDRRTTAPLKRALVSLLRSMCQLLAMAIGTLTAVILAYRLAYGVFPVPRYVFTYILYPPGPMPIDPHGTVWFFVFALILSIGFSWTTWRQSGDVSRYRISFALQLMTFSVLAYYLGRSHDNNILNLMPFMLLLLVDTSSSSQQLFARHAAAVALASILAWAAVFGWQPWYEGLRAGRLTALDFSATKSTLDYNNATIAENSRTLMGLPSTRQFEQATEIMQILHQRGEPFTVLDAIFCLRPRYHGNAWNAFHSPANFVFIPSPVRREFLARTAHRVGRGGWVIVDRKFDAEGWLADYDAIYQRTERIDREAYYAIRYALRSPADQNLVK